MAVQGRNTCYQAISAMLVPAFKERNLPATSSSGWNLGLVFRVKWTSWLSSVLGRVGNLLIAGESFQSHPSDPSCFSLWSRLETLTSFSQLQPVCVQSASFYVVWQHRLCSECSLLSHLLMKGGPLHLCLVEDSCQKIWSFMWHDFKVYTGMGGGGI